MTILTFGGILLIIAAVLQYNGKVFEMIACFVGADICWIMNAYTESDVFGMITITIGIVLGLATAYKMHTGEFVKSLKNENQHDRN